MSGRSRQEKAAAELSIGRLVAGAAWVQLFYALTSGLVRRKEPSRVLHAFGRGEKHVLERWGVGNWRVERAEDAHGCV